MTSSEYHEWKQKQLAKEYETLGKLEMYRESEKLIKAIQERLEHSQDGGELKDYLQSKLEYQGTPYGEYVSSSLDKPQDLSTHLNSQL